MIGPLIVVLHVLASFTLVIGIVARDLTFMTAGRQTSLERIGALVDLGHFFELRMVRMPTFVVLILGIGAAQLRGWPVLGALQGATVNWVFVSLLLFLSMIVPIVTILLPRGRVFRKAYDGAIAEGRVTPELTAALNDRAVHGARIYEMAGAAAIIVLMVAKPF